MTSNEQRRAAVELIKSGFRCFIEARRHLTIWEFREAVAGHLTELGGQGFVSSIGTAITEAFPSRASEQRRRRRRSIRVTTGSGIA